MRSILYQKNFDKTKADKNKSSNQILTLQAIALSASLFFLLFFLQVCKTRAENHVSSDWILSNYADESGKQGMFYTLYNPGKQKLIVIDGGWAENEKQVRKVIQKCGGVVDAWILTHYHNDHIDAFNAIYENPQGITIRRIYASPMNYNQYVAVAKEWDFPESYEQFLKLVENEENLVYVKRNDTFDMAGLSVSFVNTYDKKLLQIVGESDLPNNASLMFKIRGKEDSIFFCGDAHSKVLASWLVKQYGNLLESKYIQAGHHGNNSFPTSFYQVVDPEYMIFDAPDWLMEDEENYTTYRFLAWSEKHDIETLDFRSAPNRIRFR